MQLELAVPRAGRPARVAAACTAPRALPLRESFSVGGMRARAGLPEALLLRRVRAAGRFSEQKSRCYAGVGHGGQSRGGLAPGVARVGGRQREPQGEAGHSPTRSLASPLTAGRSGLLLSPALGETGEGANCKR